VRSRGVLVGGESIEEAFHLLRRVMNAVDTQVCSVIQMLCLLSATRLVIFAKSVENVHF